MINTNDLIGLEYGWGHRPGDGSGKTDCFQLACEVHRRLGYGDYSPLFAWVYDKYTDETFNRTNLARWLLENGRRHRYAQLGSVVLLPAVIGAAMGTYLDCETVLFIGPTHNVVKAVLPPNTGHLFWMER